MKQMSIPSDSICSPTVNPNVPYLPNIYPQIALKIPDLRNPLSTVNGILYCKERHALLMKCFKTFLICIFYMGGASDSFYKAPGGMDMVFSAKINSQLSKCTQNP